MKLRKKAVEILVRIFRDGAYSNLETASGLEGFDKREKAFITRLVYGTVSYKIQADFILSKYVSKPLEKLDIEVLCILESAVYQKLYMDSVPDYAIINESVNLAKSFGKSSAMGFVNGVLRNAFKKGLDLSDIPENTAYYYSIKYSIPKYICSMIMKQYGDYAEYIISSCREIPQTTVRVNTLKITKENLISYFENIGIKAEQTCICPDCLRLSGGLDVREDKAFKEGLFYPQDEASALSAYVLSPSKGDIVIDMCAAPGGKTTYMAQLMENQGQITAFDLYDHKIKIINDTAKRLGIDIITPKKEDTTIYNKKYLETADKIMADCPCSGLGILRKKPELGISMGEGNLPEIQYAILENAGKYLKKGGEMVYSTCTLNKEENILNIEKFLNKHQNFEIIDITDYFNGKRFKCTKKGCLQILPGEYGMDGFFICKLKKN